MGNSRTKGHSFERWLSRFFQKYYPNTKTTRAVSKLLDDCKVDLSLTGAAFESTPLLIQAKAGYDARRPKPDEIFLEMKEKLQENFPEDHEIHTKPRILIHKIKGRKEESYLVSMTLFDFERFLSEYQKNTTTKQTNIPK